MLLTTSNQCVQEQVHTIMNSVQSYVKYKCVCYNDDCSYTTDALLTYNMARVYNRLGECQTGMFAVKMSL